MYLAAFPDRLATIEQIASTYGIPQNHLAKVVQTLAHHGFIETLRGRNGGIRLALPAQEITIGAVVRATEENFDLVECFRTENTCCVTPVCSLPGALRDALEAFLHVLDEWTLADIVTNRRRWANLLTAN